MTEFLYDMLVRFFKPVRNLDSCEKYFEIPKKYTAICMEYDENMKLVTLSSKIPINLEDLKRDIENHLGKKLEDFKILSFKASRFQT